ncbi:MAG: ParA family protein [Cyanobacteria bacterium P01_E01_bin.42]
MTLPKLRLAVLGVGGSGKTTITTHSAYWLAKTGFSTVWFDFDPQGSMELFGGVGQPPPEQTVSQVLKDNFDGNYPLVSVWEKYLKDKIRACRGNLDLVESGDELVMHDRGAYLIADRLEDFPLACDAVLFDCPATLGPLCRLAVSASTHILIVTEPEPKGIKGTVEFIKWIYGTFKRLRLRPQPEILGFVINKVNTDWAIHRKNVPILQEELQKAKIHCFDPIRMTPEFKNATENGLPLHIHRPRHRACKDFKPIFDQLIAILKNE